MSSILKILLLVLYSVSLVTSLPIISKPLENNPDHLVWEALLTIDTRNIDPDKTRKVPKSIFITPNLNESKISCPNGHKLGPDGKCYKTLNIDPLDILKTQIASLFNRNRTTVEYDEYDYSDYSESTESMSGDAAGTIGQYDVPLSLGFADEQQPSSSRFPTSVLGINYDDDKFKQPFLVSTVDVASNGALKSYNVHTEQPANTDSTINTPKPTSTASTSATEDKTTTDASTNTNTTETSSTDANNINSAESTRSTIKLVNGTVIPESSNITVDVTTSATTPNKSNYSISSLPFLEKEKNTKVADWKTEIVPNLQILNKIILNKTSDVNKVEHFPFVTETIITSSTPPSLLPLDSLTVTDSERTTSEKSINENIATTPSTPSPKGPSAPSIHRFSITTLATANLISDAGPGDEQSYITTTPLSKEKEINVIQIDSSDLVGAASTASYREQNPTPSTEHMLEVSPAYDVESASVPQITGASNVGDVHLIEIVQKDDPFSLSDDIEDVTSKADVIDAQNLTARLAEELLFQGISMTLNTKYDTSNISDEVVNVTRSDSYNDDSRIENSSYAGITTQLNSFDDVATATKEPFEIDYYELSNNNSEEVVVVTPIPEVNNNSDRSEASIQDETTAVKNRESSSIYTTIMNSMHENQSTTNSNEGDDGAKTIQTGNSSDSAYENVATTDNDRDDDIENSNESTVNLSTLNGTHQVTNANGGQTEIDQTIRLGKNCYLKNYLEHFYIMCT